jgi:hypothetical protein
MRELLRVAHTSRELFTTEWSEHRAHRALCEDDGIVGPGEDYIRQFRSKIDSTWSEWQLLTTAIWTDRPNADAQVRRAPAGRPFTQWVPPQ